MDDGDGTFCIKLCEMRRLSHTGTKSKESSEIETCVQQAGGNDPACFLFHRKMRPMKTLRVDAHSREEDSYRKLSGCMYRQKECVCLCF